MRQPVVFLAHGDPMNALRDNAFTRGLRRLGEEIGKPAAVVVFSAHWCTRGTRVGASAAPETIHDFGGFPDELYRERYPAPGDPTLAARIASLLPGSRIDPERGLDHGIWTVLKFLLPDADVPVVPVSIDATATPEALFEQGRALRELREEGVLIAGSGNIVHNIGAYFSGRDDAPFPWATEFDAYVREALARRDAEALFHFERAGSSARMSHPSVDHLLPLFPCFGAADDREGATFPHEEVVRSMSMRCVRWG